MNQTIEACGEYLVVRESRDDQTTEGGIIISSNVPESHSPPRGEVVSIGREAAEKLDRDVRVGDTVYFNVGRYFPWGSETSFCFVEAEKVFAVVASAPKSTE